jgi:hypothetical protein
MHQDGGYAFGSPVYDVLGVAESSGTPRAKPFDEVAARVSDFVFDLFFLPFQILLSVHNLIVSDGLFPNVQGIADGSAFGFRHLSYFAFCLMLSESYTLHELSRAICS